MRYRSPSSTASFASAVSGPLQLKKKRSSLETPLLGYQEKRKRSSKMHQHRSFMRQSASALKTTFSGFRNQLSTKVKSSKLMSNALYYPTMEVESFDEYDIPPPPPLPPLARDSPLFDSEVGSMNHFRSYHFVSITADNPFEQSVSGDIDVWDLPAQPDDIIDFSLTNILNNSPSYEEDEDKSINSIPSIHSSNCQHDGIQEQNSFTQEAEVDDVADSVILVGFLGAVFGSPAPKAVQKKTDASASILWYDEEAKVDHQFDLVKELEALDMCSDNITSDWDSIPDLDSKNNEDVDSALAWSALSLLLASPAPASITKKSSRREDNVAKLWEFDEGEDIPDLAVEAIDAKGADPVVLTNSCIHAGKQEQVD